MQNPLIGILGGMGPSATNDFIAKIIAVTPASSDQDHIPLAVWSNPRIPDRNKAIYDPKRFPSPSHDLQVGARKLQDLGSDLIAIACNTAHHWHADIQAAVRIPVLHIADVACVRLAAMGLAKGDGVGLLCTEGTRQSGYYDARLRQSGLRVVYPDEARQEQIMNAVYAIKRRQLAEARAITGEVATTLASANVKALLVACTELPIVLDGTILPLPTLDATLCLAEACVAAATAIQHSRANVSSR
jgi:aspartate racemase